MSGTGKALRTDLTSHLEKDEGEVLEETQPQGTGPE